MTLILFRIDNQLQCIVGLTFITGTKDFMVTTQSTNNDQETTLFCSPNSAHYPFIEAILKKPPQITLKVRKENFKRLIATNNFIPGVLHCGSAKPTI